MELPKGEWLWGFPLATTKVQHHNNSSPELGEVARSDGEVCKMVAPTPRLSQGKSMGLLHRLRRLVIRWWGSCTTKDFRLHHPKGVVFFCLAILLTSELVQYYQIKKNDRLFRRSLSKTFVVLGMGFEPMISRMRILRPGPARRTEHCSVLVVQR